MTTNTDSAVKTRIAINTRVKVPSDYKVIYMNDNITTMEFVVETLHTIFGHDYERAEEITEEVHVEGSAVVAVLPHEIAEHKGVEVTMLARNNGYPLAVKLEAAD